MLFSRKPVRALRSRPLTFVLANGVFCLTINAAAQAATPAAKILYDKGATEYNLGHFAEAIVNFEKAYELDPAPILLFNIAQSHRQSGDNEKALFFYRRYLEHAAPDASNRADVEKRVKDLEEVLAQQSEIKRKPPTQVEDNEHHLAPAAPFAPTIAPPPLASTQPPAAGATSSGGLASSSPTPSRDPVAFAATRPAATNEPPDLFRVGVEAGVAFSQFHGADLEQPGQLALRAFGGYLVTLAPFPLELGAALSFSPLPYKTPTEDKTASLLGLWARAAAVLPVAPSLDVLGELGAGVVWWSGIEEGNPFTSGGTASTGAIPMPSVRLSVGVRYQLPAHIFLYAAPAFTWCKTTSGLGDSVSSVTRIELPLGAGVSF